MSGDGSGLSSIQSSNVSDFASNVTRITNLESSDMTIGGEKTFSSNLRVGTADLFVNTTTGRVGVGTNSPSGELHVRGENMYLQSALVSNCTWRIMPQTGNSTKLFRIYDQDNSADRLVINASGNVGIGTANPDTDLHVYGSSSQTNIYLGEDGTTDKAGIIKYFQGNGTGTGTLHLGHWGDSFSSTQTLCIQKGGNVGIGTASPRERLELYGNFLGTANSTLYSHNLYYDTAWKYGEAGYGGATLRMIDSEVQFWNAANDNATANSAATVVQRMTIAENGNVGIGTASPAFKLDVHGTSNVGALTATTGTFSGALVINGGPENDTTPALTIGGGFYDESDLYVLNTYNVNTGVGYAAKVLGVNIKNKVETNNSIQIRKNTGGLTSAGAIYLGSDDVNQGIFGVLGGTGVAGSTLGEYLTVKANGNVGIGTASPGGLLEVSGTAESPIIKRNSTASTATYNYLLNGPRPGTTSGGAVHFINGSTRSGDGGGSTYTIRNDSGPTVFGNGSYVNRPRKPKDDDYIIGTWKTSLDASATTTVGLNVRSCVSTPAAPGGGMSGNIGRFTAPEDGYYYTYVQTVQTTRGTSNLLIVFNAGGTNFGTNNLIGTYDEIIDLRSANNVEENYNFVATLYMEAGDYIQYSVHSSGYTDNSTYHMQCSAFLLNRV